MRGRCIKLGDYINTDLIYPGKYLSLTEPEEMVLHVLEDLDPDLPLKLKDVEILVAGKHLGCGSSREQAVSVIKYAGIRAIVAKSFARIFYRNCVNQGIYPLTCDHADKINDGDILDIDVEKGCIENKSKGEIYECGRIPPFMLEIIEDGGLVPHLRKKYAREK